MSFLWPNRVKRDSNLHNEKLIMILNNSIEFNCDIFLFSHHSL